MNTSTLTNYIKDAIGALSQIKKATHHQKPASWDVSGWVYNPPSLKFNGGLGSYVFSSENTDPDFYFISTPEVHENNSSDYQVSFLFGHLKNEYQSSGMDLFLSIVMHFDGEGQPRGTGHIDVYDQSNSSGFTSFPLPGGVPFLPGGLGIGVNTALVAAAYAKDLNEWLVQQGYTNIYGALEALSGFAAVVIDQVAFGVRAAFLEAPELTVSHSSDLNLPFDSVTRTWAEADWEHDTWFDKTYSGQSVRFWWPTFVAQPEAWTSVIKFDMIRSAAKDDHVIVLLAGAIDRDTARYGQPSRFTGSLGQVLTITAISNYQHSGGQSLTVSETQPEGEGQAQDVLEAWLNAWERANETQPPSTRNFASGVSDLVAKYVAQLRTVSSTPMAGMWDVSSTGSNHTSIFMSPAGNVVSGCSGSVYVLDPESIYGNIFARRTLPNAGANDVSFCGDTDVGYAGCNGYVYAFNWDDLTDAFGESESAPDYNLSPLAGHGVTRVLTADRRLFAACNGWVFELAPGRAEIVWSYNLNQLSTSMGHNETNLCFHENQLYAATNGFVARLDVPADPVCTGPASTSSYYNLPHCGNHSTTLAHTGHGDVFAACNGWAFKLDPASLGVSWSTPLSGIDSRFGEQHTELCVVRNGTLLAGSNGFVARLSQSKGGYHKDDYDNKCCDVSSGGNGIVYLANDGEAGLAATKGYVYRLNANHYNIVDGPPTGSATLRYDMNLSSNRSEVHIGCAGGSIFAGMSGTVEALPLKPFNYG